MYFCRLQNSNTSAESESMLLKIYGRSLPEEPSDVGPVSFFIYQFINAITIIISFERV